MNRIKFIMTLATVLIIFSGCGEDHSTENNPEKTNMCEKDAMQSDGIVRLSKIQVNPEYIDEYMEYAVEVGTVSLETEPGVLTMYAMADKENPCNITILETYSSQEAYKSHIASEHFRKYKQGTLHMVDSLILDDVTPLNPVNQIINFINREWIVAICKATELGMTLFDTAQVDNRETCQIRYVIE